MRTTPGTDAPGVAYFGLDLMKAHATTLAILALLAAQPVAAAGSKETGRAKARQCAVCHGIDGVSKRPDVPHIAGESIIYLKAQLEAFRSGKRHHREMSIVAQGLSDADIADLIAWYSAIEFTVVLPE